MSSRFPNRVATKRLLRLTLTLALLTFSLTPATSPNVATALARDADFAKQQGQSLQFRAGDHLLAFQPDSVYLATTDHVLSVQFSGANPVVPQAIAVSSLGAASMTEVRYRNLWPGISLRYEATEDGIVKSTYTLVPRANPGCIRLRYNTAVAVTADGSLVFEVPSARGSLSESAPLAWQEIGGQRVMVAVSFTALDEQSVGFIVGDYDPAYPLVIDPVYKWHTFYGSDSRDSGLYDRGRSIAVDANHNVYVTGDSEDSWNGPGGQAPLHAHSGDENHNDIFVLKLNGAGAYQWHTFYGSGNYDEGWGIVARGIDNVYVTGYSWGSWNGPSGETPLHAYTGADIFVLKLNGAGAYQWHTFYGSAGSNDYANDIALDGYNNIYVTGYSNANWYGPGTRAPLHRYRAGNDIFVLKLTSSGTYQWHTFYGSLTYDIGSGITVDENNNVYVAGYGDIWFGPDDEDPLHEHNDANDIVVFKLNSYGAYQWHTFQGSSVSEYSYGIAYSDSKVYVTGYSNASWNGPGGQAPLHAISGAPDMFVLELTVDGAYGWHTFYGSAGADYGQDIATDIKGNVYATGYSDTSWNGPTGQAPLHAHSGGDYDEIFVTRLGNNGVYYWHTFYGSESGDYGYGIAVDSLSNVYVTGRSWLAWDGPGGQAPLHAFSGGYGYDAAVVKTESFYVTTTTVSSSLNPSTYGQAVTFTATVTSSAWTPTGTVHFDVDGLDLGGPVVLHDGSASITTSALPGGTHLITAEYGGDPNFHSSTGTLEQVVNRISTTTTLASSANPSLYGDSVTFTATVTGGSGTPTGTVQFKADGVNLGAAVTLSGSSASTSTSTLAVGDHTITAEYSGSGNHSPSTGTLDQSVISLAPPPTHPRPTVSGINPSTGCQGGRSFTLTITGTNFVQESVVRWNGNDRSTTFVSETELRITVTTSDLAAFGEASITVFNPGPGGGESNSVIFVVMSHLQLPQILGS